MEIFYGFKVCRVCLTPRSKVKVSTLFSEKAEKFLKVGGVDVRKDENKFEAVICDSCWLNLTKIGKLIENFNRSFKNWNDFGKRLQETFDSSHEKEDFGHFRLVCRCCSMLLQVTQLKMISESTSEQLKKLSGVDVRAEGLSSRLVCEKCSKLLEQSVIIRENIENAETFYFTERRNEEGSGQTESKGDNENAVSTLKADHAGNSKKTDGQTSSKKQSTINKFKCEICSKSYSHKGSLTYHINTIHIKMRPFYCDLCEYSTHVKGRIEDHINRHHSQTRLFKCSFNGCSKYFKTNKDVKQHFLVHSDVRPFVCECGKAFKSRATLYHHRRNKLKKINETTSFV